MSSPGLPGVSAPFSPMWTPPQTMLPAPFWAPEQFSFPKLVKAIREDIIVADRVFLPNSPELFSHQILTMKALAAHKTVFIEGCRGSAKTWTVGRYALVEALRNKITVVCTGPTYRQALLVFAKIVEFIRENIDEESSMSLARELDGPINEKGTMKAVIRFKNGSQIVALPMGSGENIRGERADILICDEFFKMEKTMYKLHIVPFLLGHKPKDAVGPKLIMSTSAEFEDSYAYQVLTKIMLPNVVRESKIKAIDPTYKPKYCVLEFNIDDLRSSVRWNAEENEWECYDLGQDVLDLLLEGANEEERQQQLYNRWVGLGGVFMPANLLDRMSSAAVHIEHERDPSALYSLAVDVATAENGDNFVIQVLKHIDGVRKSALVNSYWDRGRSADEMAWYIHEFNRKFRPETIVMDKGGGGLFVLSSLSKPKLVMQDGSEKVIQTPLLEWNEYGAVNGDRKVVMTRPSDDKVREAFAGDRSRGGEYIHSEDIFVHLLYDGLKHKLTQTDIGFIIPATVNTEAGDVTDDFGRPESEILANIRESVRQLKYLSIKTQVDESGVRTVVQSKVNKVPTYKWKNSQKDGAVSFAYGYIAHNLHFPDKRGGAPEEVEAIIVPQSYGAFSAWGLVEDTSQNYNPYGNT